MKRLALTIAGSDPSGGAGLQRDLAVFRSLGVPAVSVITAITAQNEKKFWGLHPVPSEILRAQLESVASSFHVIKIGMLATAENVRVVTRFLKKHRDVPVVLDPILKSSTGAVLLERSGILPLCDELAPLVTLVTPNLDEAAVLCRTPIKNIDDMKKAVRVLCKRLQTTVLLKGGHLTGSVVVDLLWDGKREKVFTSRRIHVRDLRGTGCRLSSAIAAYLCQGVSLEKSVSLAKSWLRTSFDKPPG